MLKRGGLSLKQASLFDNLKFCSICQRYLPFSYEEELCKECIDNELFHRVKEYIRSTDVTEFEVAEYFEIPHRKVRKWIRQGRIQYKEQDKSKIASLYCSCCGESINFGKFCDKCYRDKYNTKGGYAPLREVKEENKMRFITEE